MDALQTDIFKMKRWNFAIEMVAIYGKPWVTTESLLLLASLAAAVFIDLRWAVIFLMLLFIITPAMFAFLYYFHGLKPGCVANIIAHRITFQKDCLVVTLFKKHEGDEEPADVQYLPVSSFSIEYSSLPCYATGINSVTLHLGKGREEFIWIPISAFSAPSAFNKAMERVLTGMRKSVSQKSNR